MYRITIKQGESESIMEFDSAELAILYRDYHLAFGHWQGIAKWVEEKDVTPEQRKFIVDEMSELKEGVVVRLFKLSEGVELKVEKASHGTLPEVWDNLREARNKLLVSTDWTQLADTALDMSAKKDYRSYRSYLRVLPSLHNDGSVVGAKVYSFDSWKKGNR
jgi:hypothetical protein